MIDLLLYTVLRTCISPNGPRDRAFVRRFDYMDLPHISTEILMQTGRKVKEKWAVI